MRRREFITLLGGVAASWPLVARAQQAGKLPTIGFLGTTTPSAQNQWTAAFVQRLRELGWIEGRTVAIEYRWGEGRNERFADIAAEFVRLKVDVIVTGGAAVLAAKQATSVIPIVFALALDPLGSGFVVSLARPGGNITGLSFQAPDLAGKRLELLRRFFRASADWRFCPTSAIPTPSWKWARLKLRPAPSALKSPNWKSGEPRISPPLSRRSRAARMRFMFAVTPSRTPTGFASIP